jgi:O-antigen ligase
MLKDYLRWGIYACLFVTPFLANYVSDSMFFPFITGKNFAFRILTEVALALYIILALLDSTVRPKYTHLLGSFGAFIGVIFLADIFGVDPHKSLWSNYERSEGFVTHIHLFLYFIVLASVMRTEKLWVMFANSWLVSSIFIFLAGVGQFIGKERFYMGHNRVDAGLGNSEYVGIFGIFNAFLAALLFVRTDKGHWARYWYVVMGLVNFFLVFMSGTRGSVLGLIGGIMLALALFAFLDKRHPQYRKYAIGVVASIIVFGAALMLNPEAKIVKAIPVLDRVAHIRIDEGTAESRITIWKMSWEGFKDRPILGWGQENFIQVFAEEFDPKASRLEPWYDRSHDVFFDWLIAAGALGLIAYLSLYVAALYCLWFFEKGKRFSLAEKTIITGMLAAYFIHNIFVFDCLMSYMFFFGVLAWIAQRSYKGEAKNEKSQETLDSGDVAIVAAVVFTVLAVVVYYVNIRNITANQELIMTMQGNVQVMRDGKPYPRIAALLEPGLIGTNEAREQLIQQALGVAQQAQEGKVEKKFADEYLELADKNIRLRLEENPRDLRMISFAITFYGSLNQMDQAEELFKQGVLISPKRGALYLEMAQVRGARGDFNGALEAAKKAVEFMPGSPQAYGMMGVLLAYTNQPAELEKLYVEADKFVRGQTRLQFAQAFNKVGLTAKAQTIAAKAVEEDPALAEQLKPKATDKKQ